MNKLVNAMQSGRMMGRTENGAVAHMTTANRLLDVFFAADRLTEAEYTELCGMISANNGGI